MSLSKLTRKVSLFISSVQTHAEKKFEKAHLCKERERERERERDR